MKYVSTRKGIEATSAETVFQGLAPDGGLYVPVLGSDRVELGSDRVELGSGRVELGSDRVELGSDRVELGSDRVGLGSGRVELGADRVELGSGRVELGSDRVGLGSGRVELGADRVESTALIDTKKTLDDTRKTLDDTRKTLSDSKKTLCDAKKTLDDAKSTLSDAKKTLGDLKTLRDAEDFVMSQLFDDLPAEVRAAAADRLCARFPAEDPIPLVEKDGLHILELFHGKTGAFKDVALSMLPVFMKHAANGKRVLILTATSGDTGSAAMQGFAGVEGTEIIVFYPATGTSKIQRLQMTTPADANVHAVGIRGNFDDAQAAVKRIFADSKINAEAAAHGITLSSANSINTGRLVPQIAYYILAGAKLQSNNRTIEQFDVVVPSGNFGNILAAYYAKLLGSPIRKLVVASNVNDVLARFVKTGVYDPGPTFTVTNSPSMDIRKSSNVERLLWMISGGLDGDVAGACAETARMMNDLETKGRYELSEKAKARLFADFVGGVATPEETEAEMRRMRESCGYLLDPHTAVATCVAKRLMDGKFCASPASGKDSASPLLGDVPVVVAATATPYKFPETCFRAFGEDVLSDPPPSFRDLEKLPIAQKKIVAIGEIDQSVRDLF